MENKITLNDLDAAFGAECAISDKELQAIDKWMSSKVNWKDCQGIDDYLTLREKRKLTNREILVIACLHRTFVKKNQDGGSPHKWFIQYSKSKQGKKELPGIHSIHVSAVLIMLSAIGFTTLKTKGAVKKAATYYVIQDSELFPSEAPKLGATKSSENTHENYDAYVKKLSEEPF